MTVRDIGRDYRWVTGRSHNWLIVVALVCLLLAMASLVILRFSFPRLPSARIAEVLLWVALGVAMALLFEWMRRNRPADVSRFFGSRSRTKAIDKLYAELRPLMSRAVEDPSLQQKVDAKLDLLRQLQTEEAEEMLRRFDEGLSLKPGEALETIEQGRRLLALYGITPPSDTPSKPEN